MRACVAGTQHRREMSLTTCQRSSGTFPTGSQPGERQRADRDEPSRPAPLSPRQSARKWCDTGRVDRGHYPLGVLCRLASRDDRDFRGQGSVAEQLARDRRRTGGSSMNDDFDEILGPELTADEEALLKEMPTLTDVGQTRRTFLGQTIAGSLGWFALDLLAHEKAFAALSPSPGAVFAAGSAVENPVKVVLKVNCATTTLDTDSR